MTPRTWVIIGATSVIAEEFAHCAACAGHQLRLVGRDKQQLELIANDIVLRYRIVCDFIIMDMQKPVGVLAEVLKPGAAELDLFIAHSDFTGNKELNNQTIATLIQTNITATTQLIHAYLHMQQNQHRLIYLSSVAACRGRGQNSLYGASKAAIEVYLEGLQHAAPNTQHITIVRLGFIDTKQTYGLPGIFHAASAEDCAKACWKASSKNQRFIYYPGFWRLIMAIITRLPFRVYKKLFQNPNRG